MSSYTISFTALFLIIFCQASSQDVEWLTITPSAPSTTDTIQATIHIAFNNFDTRKLGGTLVSSGDSTAYFGCYYNPSLIPTLSDVYDTITLMPQSAGLHYLRVIARYVGVNTDSTCASTNPAWNDTLDTVFAVTTPNAISFSKSTPFHAMALSYDKISITSEKSSNLDIKVMDVSGRLCFDEKNIELHIGNNDLDLSIQELPQGIYFYELVIGGEREILKVIKRD